MVVPAGARQRYPGATLPPEAEWPALAAIVLEADLTRTRAHLTSCGIDCAAGKRLVVSPEAACGTLLEFVPAANFP